MITTRISDYRSNLSTFHKRVLEDHEPLLVSGSSRGDLVVIPAADYERLKESIQVLKDRATMNSLLQNRSDFAEGTADYPDIEGVFDDV